jgi:hypothetical protein
MLCERAKPSMVLECMLGLWVPFGSLRILKSKVFLQNELGEWLSEYVTLLVGVSRARCSFHPCWREAFGAWFAEGTVGIFVW